MKKTGLFLLSVLSLTLSVLSFNQPLVFAGQCGDIETAILDCGEDTKPKDIIQNRLLSVVDIMSIGVGILGVVGIAVFGIQYLTAGSNSDQVVKAKKRLFQIILGLIVYAAMIGLLHWLLPSFDPSQPGGSPPASESSSSSSSRSGTTAAGIPKTSTKTGFATINNKKYYYDNNHNLVYGEKKIGKNWYYFDKTTGAMKTNGFQKVGSKTYYYDKNGHKAFGPQTINKKSYYFNEKTGAKYNGKLYFGVPIGNYHSIRQLTPSKIVSRAKQVLQYVHSHKKFDYGDSGSYPPGTDNYISCERLVSVILYSYGFKDQPRNGGYKIANGFLSWLNSLGFVESHSTSDIKKGSIVWLRYAPDDGEIGHVFVVASWNRKTGVFKRYDTGSRWNHKQPIVTNGFPYDIYNGNLKVFNLP